MSKRSNVATGRSPARPYRLTFHPLTPDRWDDLEALFGPRGACGGCWCMWWRMKRSQWEKQKGNGNKCAFQEIVKSGAQPGVLAYSGREPIGWCAIGPREAYPVLDRSRVLKPVDDQKVWSITCFYVARAFRRRGVTVMLIREAVKSAKRNGAMIVEGYPVDPQADSMPEAFAWTGLASAFRQAGFHEVARRSKSRPVMRLEMARPGRRTRSRRLQ